MYIIKENHYRTNRRNLTGAYEIVQENFMVCAVSNGDQIRAWPEDIATVSDAVNVIKMLLGKET